MFDEAMKAGYVTVRINTVLLFGMAGAGKTSTMHLLLGLSPPEERNSTPLAESVKQIQVRDISKTKIQVNESSWKQVTLEDMKKQTSKFLHQKYPDPPLELGNKMKQLSNSDRDNTSPTVPVLSGNQDDSATKNAAISITKLASELQTLSFKDKITSQEEEIFCYDLVYVIDSGGQPQFHNLLPLFVQGISTVVYIFNLSYGPDEYPIIKHCKRGKTLEEYQSNITNVENFCFLIQSINSQNNQCRLVCIGTHRDKADARLISESNCRLLELLPKHFRESENCVYKNGEAEFIFSINTLVKHNREKLTKELQNVIWPPLTGPFQRSTFNDIKVPAWWYFFEIMLKTQFGDRKVLHFEECMKIAHELNFHKDALVEALRFFHKHHIFHYYHFLPNVVFCDTQVLLDKVTEIVEYAASPITVGSGVVFANEGIVTLKTLSKFPKHYVEDLFEPKDLIIILENLLILTKRSDSSSEEKQYIMPATLRNLPESELEKHRTFSSPIAPLLICFKSGFIKCGVFCCLQVHLLKRGWELSNKVKPKQNCMRYRVDTFLVTLINSHNYRLEIHVKPCISDHDSETCAKFCLEVKKLILEDIGKAQRNLGYDATEDTELGFFCPHKVTSQQESTCYQVALVKNENMVCKKYDEHCTKLQERHNVWYCKLIIQQFCKL